MQISTDNRGGVTIVAIAGDANALTADELTTYLDERVKDGMSGWWQTSVRWAT